MKSPSNLSLLSLQEIWAHKTSGLRDFWYILILQRDLPEKFTEKLKTWAPHHWAGSLLRARGWSLSAPVDSSPSPPLHPALAAAVPKPGEGSAPAPATGLEPLGTKRIWNEWNKWNTPYSNKCHWYSFLMNSLNSLNDLMDSTISSWEMATFACFSSWCFAACGRLPAFLQDERPCFEQRIVLRVLQNPQWHDVWNSKLAMPKHDKTQSDIPHHEELSSAPQIAVTKRLLSFAHWILCALAHSSISFRSASSHQDVKAGNLPYGHVWYMHPYVFICTHKRLWNWYIMDQNKSNLQCSWMFHAHCKACLFSLASPSGELAGTSQHLVVRLIGSWWFNQYTVMSMDWCEGTSWSETLVAQETGNKQVARCDSGA